MHASNESEEYRLCDCFIRTFWKRNSSWSNGREPGCGPKKYIARRVSFSEARAIYQQYNTTHDPGPLFRKAEFEER